MKKSSLIAIWTIALWFSAAASCCGVELRILHLNDLHGFVEPFTQPGSSQPVGGIARIACVIDVLRTEKPTLLLAAGDMIQGTPWTNLSQGKGVIEIMNAMKFDAMVLGNHEFDFGQDVLRKRIGEARFPVLAANVDGLQGVRPYVVKQIAGLRVGIIGVVTEETPVTTSPRNVTGLVFAPADAVVARYVAELKGKVDLLVVLSHRGLQADRELAERVGGIQVIVGGHSHTKVEKPLQTCGVIVAQAWEHGKTLGILDLDVENGRVTATGRLMEIRRDEPDVADIVADYRSRLDAELNRPVAESEVDLSADGIRCRETNLGDLVADVMRRAAGADVAIINSGSIRTGISKGVIRVRDIYAALPFDSYLVALKITGRQLRSILEHGVSATERGEGRFPQVSGLSFTFNSGLPPGRRVGEVSVNGKPLDPAASYRVATNDFLAAGGDGYRTFAEAIAESGVTAVTGGAFISNNSGKWLRDLIVENLSAYGVGRPRVEGRIVEIRQESRENYQEMRGGWSSRLAFSFAAF